MKKGFTLIELLAVIIILAVIALIATPIVIDVINDSKDSVAYTETQRIVEAVNNYCQASGMMNQLDGSSNSCKDGITLEELALMVDTKKAEVVKVDYSNKVDFIIVKSNGRNVVYNGVLYDLVDTDNYDEMDVKYTVKKDLNATTVTTAWTRMDDAVGKVANATKDGSAVTNDFDNIYPWSDIISYNYNTSSKKVTAYYGDTKFKFDGSNGEVLTKIPTFYYRRWQENGIEYQSISKYPLPGYSKSDEFSVGRYTSSFSDSKLHSKSGVKPQTSKNITWFRTESNKLGSEFGQMDYHYNLIQMLYLVEYADYNSQSKLGEGITRYRTDDNDKALIAENSTNRIVIETSRANNFAVGQIINIGKTSSWGTDVAVSRTITKKESYSANGVTGTAIYFNGAAVNIAVDYRIGTGSNALTASGGTNSLGMKSGTLNNDGKHSMIYRGMEDIFGHIWQFVDGVNIKDNIAYVSTDKNDYAVDKFDGSYQALGYTNATTNNWPKTLGYDSNNSLFAFPNEVISNSNYVSDYYYQNSGNRIALVGGAWADNSVAGLWYWNLNTASSYSSVFVGSRLLKLG